MFSILYIYKSIISNEINQENKKKNSSSIHLVKGVSDNASENDKIFIYFSIILFILKSKLK